MTREQFIQKNSKLFWYTPEDQKQNISDALLVETILNYGTLDDYRELVNVLGGKLSQRCFFQQKVVKKPIIILKYIIFSN